MKRNIFLILLMPLFSLLFIYAIKSALTPQPGQSVPDLGRQHISAGTKAQYNSNPPTSGPHYEEWGKAGIYTQELVDERTVHSLEHGYVIISYNCRFLSGNKPQSFSFPQVYAHQEDGITKTADPTSPKIESQQNQDNDCQKLTEQLGNLANQQKLWKLIVVPRSILDSRIALTAWRRIDKFNEFDEKRIIDFVKAFRNTGPEKTMD